MVQNMVRRTYLIAFFQQHLIVLAESNTEYDRCDVLKAVYPLLALATLTPHVKHAAGIR